MPNSQLPLTVIILTHRNDQLFLDSLNSADFASEIIILDNNSQNNWHKLKAKYKQLQVITYPQAITDFAKLRNNLIKKATYEWVLFLDSDEILENQAAKKIQKILERKNTDAAYLKRVDYFLGKPLYWGELYNSHKLRLGKKHEFRFLGAIHEIGEHSGNIKKSNILLKHYSHASISSFLNKIIFYANAIADQEEKQYRKYEVIIELLLNPPGKFIYNFILKLGFLDGWRGLTYAFMMSLHSAFVRIMLYEKLAKKHS